MGTFSSNGTKAAAKRKPQSGGGFFTRRQRDHRAFMWAEVDGDLFRMTLDALMHRGYGLACFVAPGGRGVKVRLYAEGPPSDEIVMDAGEFNGLCQWIIDDLSGDDAEMRKLFDEVSTWLENRDR